MNEKNTKVLVFLLFLIFFILLGRLFQLQVIEGKENRFLSDNNRIARIKIEAPRGLILDRHGEVLADNEPLYVLSEGVDQNKEIPREEALNLQAQGQDQNLKILLKRRYSMGSFFAHALGYLGEVTEEELKEQKLDLKGYHLGSLIGRVGLEAQYEELLMGREGSELAEVDTRGKIIRRMGRILPSPGKSLTLALDSKLQQKAVEAMGEKKGAIIASNPNTGEILTFYSSPTYDPNVFLDKQDRTEVLKLISDEKNLPLLNRVIAGLFPPGSTFKIITSIAGLEEKKIDAKTTILDTGVIYYGAFKYSNWYFTSQGKTDGEVNVVKALARSNDIFFYKLGEMIGIEKLNYWADKFGVNKKFGIDLPGELPGFMATPEWKQRVKGENWFLGNTYHMSIGQGDLDLTPLGVNMMTNVVATGGQLCQPRMLKIGAENTPYSPECKEIEVKKENLQLVKKGMINACSPGGTAGSFFDFDPQVACKTGTAETGDGKTTHAWFTVFAPADNPEISITVLVERGGEGSSVSAPIAKEILEEYFKSR